MFITSLLYFMLVLKLIGRLLLNVWISYRETVK